MAMTANERYRKWYHSLDADKKKALSQRKTEWARKNKARKDDELAELKRRIAELEAEKS